MHVTGAVIEREESGLMVPEGRLVRGDPVEIGDDGATSSLAG